MKQPSDSRRQLLPLLLFFTFMIVPCGGYSRTPGDCRYFANALVSRHLRDGYTDFGDNRIEHVSPEPIITFGGSFGRNFRFPAELRVGVPLVVEYGVTNEGVTEEIVLEDGTAPEVRLNTVMYHAGLQPELQIPIRLTSDVWAYGAAGAGVHYTMVAEEERTNDTRKIRVIDDYLEKSSTIKFSLVGGAGLERSMNSRLGLSIQYHFTYWVPVARTTSKDLYPLEAQPYTERFLTHSVSFGIMISRYR